MAVVERVSGAKIALSGEKLGLSTPFLSSKATNTLHGDYQGGKIAEMWVVNDMLGFFQQLGVIPPLGEGEG